MTTITLDMNKAMQQAHKMASKAKPGTMKIHKDIYTFEFDQKNWDYKVYKNLEHYVTFNTKQLKTAKQWLLDYLNN